MQTPSDYGNTSWNGQNGVRTVSNAPFCMYKSQLNEEQTQMLVNEAKRRKKTSKKKIMATSCETQAEETSLRKKKTSRKKIVGTSCETQAEETSLRKKKTSRKKIVGTSCETQAEETSLRKKRTRKKDALEKTAITSAEVQDKEELKEKGRTLITEMRSRRSKPTSPKRRKSKVAVSH
ncbi:hypothetical protein TELCIR_05995 [Teladorsagia circumcincta]|uniref:Uncharacterized protein n=1 Tax=Teladorsagia circumcincta TaxID=45464 RepID=A0A2G9UPC0_TELCI|nr:hypothetical protein TELCIR_05995 [Teladorsagia circumcincta]